MTKSLTKQSLTKQSLTKQALTSNDLIKHYTEIILSNIGLIQNYNERINSIEFSEHKKYFTKELDRYKKTVVELEEENKEYQQEIDKLSNNHILFCSI